jgi:hypothetical protein
MERNQIEAITVPSFFINTHMLFISANRDKSLMQMAQIQSADDSAFNPLNCLFK